MGFRLSADLDLGGSDTFAGIRLSSSVVYFDNVIEATDLDDFYKFDVSLRYDFTKNFGLKIGYEKGRNEDTLQEIDMVSAAVTIKLGEAEKNKQPVLE